VVWLVHGAKDVAPGVKILRTAGIPNYAFPRTGVKSLARRQLVGGLARNPRRQLPVFNDLNVEGANKIVADLLNDHPALPHPGRLSPAAVVLRHAAVAKHRGQGRRRCARLAESFGVPVVMKVMSADVIHKYDAGGVILNVHGAEEAAPRTRKSSPTSRSTFPVRRSKGCWWSKWLPRGWK